MVKNPWKTVDQKVVYKSPYFELSEDKVVRPDGKPGLYNVFKKGRSNQVIAVNDVGQILLVGQWRYPTGRYSWEFPGGKVEGEETLFEAGARELWEESGLVAESWENLGPLDILNGHSSDVFDVIVANGVKPGQGDEMAEEGIDRFMWVSTSQALDMVGSHITNSPAVAALALYMRYIAGTLGLLSNF